MNIKMKLIHLITVSLAILLSACNPSNNNVPIQSNGEYIDNNSHYQNPPITTTDAIAVGAVGVATGYALSKQANKPRYSKSNTNYGKPVVVVNNHYYQSGGGNNTRTKYKSTYRKRK